MAVLHRLLMLAWGGSPTPYKPAWRAAACPSRCSEPAARFRHLRAFQRLINHTKCGGCCLEKIADLCGGPPRCNGKLANPPPARRSSNPELEPRGHPAGG